MNLCYNVRAPIASLYPVIIYCWTDIKEALQITILRLGLICIAISVGDRSQLVDQRLGAAFLAELQQR